MRLISGCEEEAAMAHRIRPLTAATAAAALLVLLAACASTSASVSSSASCAAILHFRGQTYYGEALRTHSPYTRTGRVPKAHMHVIGTGVIPACRDTNHSTDQDRSVPVARIDGVDPGVAVAQYLAHYAFGLVFVNKLSLTTINTG
jgi:hypothetical protein